MKNTRVTTICNSKGGIGKTTTTLAFTYRLASKGYKVLAIDIDSQSNLTRCFGVYNDEKPDIFDWLIKNVDARIHINDNIDIIPSTDKGIGALLNECRKNPVSPSGYLENGLALYDEYDFVFIDVPSGGMGFETTNAIIASDYVVIPTEPNFLSQEGMEGVSRTIADFMKYKPTLVLTGIVINSVKTNTKAHQTGMEEIREKAAEENVPVYKTFVRQSTLIEKAQREHKDFYNDERINPAAKDFACVVDEFLEKIGE